MAYCEQVGTCLQEVGSKGEMVYWYILMGMMVIQINALRNIRINFFISRCLTHEAFQCFPYV